MLRHEDSCALIKGGDVTSVKNCIGEECKAEMSSELEAMANRAVLLG